MKRLLMTLIFAAVFMSTSAQAANGQLYVSGNLGFGFATDLEEFGTEISFDPGWNIIGALGYDMGKFRIEGEIGYHEVGIDQVTVAPLPPLPIDGDASLLTFMANAYYDHEMGNSPLTPYVGFGLGLADTDIEILGVSGGDVELAYQFLLGLGYEISPNLVLTGGYRFLGIVESGSPDIHEFNFGGRFMF